MRKKIRGSIAAKTFLGMMLLHIVCCVIIYGMVMVFLPRNYQTELESQFLAEFQELVMTLEEKGITDSSQEITGFSMRNYSDVLITGADGQDIVRINTATMESIENDSQMLDTYSQFRFGGETYHISAAASLVAAARSYDILIKLIPFIVAMVILISVTGAYICSHHFSKPLIDICGVARRMAQLDMTWKCDTSRSDEIGILAVSLNKMSGRLKEALDSLQAANEQLQEDIEKERRQERQRIDFFTSVSHELKTPITVIKGELEGMIYEVGEYKDRDAYLKHALGTVNDMEVIVGDILIAARMGGPDFRLNCTDINLARLVGRCCRKVKGIAEDKQMVFLDDLQQDVPYHGDERLLQQAFSNIISNAVLYSPERARVEVALTGHCLIVQNTGAHIKEEDLEQLFIPFFRVDKSRNRNTGGSGLGLYIAKTVFEHHGISYKVENTSDGVRFTVLF